MRGKNSQKSARIVALAHAIQEGYFNPTNVNMSDLARGLGVSRGTIMRDLVEVDEMLDEAKRIQSVLRSLPTTETHRRK